MVDVNTNQREIGSGYLASVYRSRYYSQSTFIMTLSHFHNYRFAFIVTIDSFQNGFVRSQYNMGLMTARELSWPVYSSPDTTLT